jgi:hypothetical protein
MNVVSKQDEGIGHVENEERCDPCEREVTVLKEAVDFAWPVKQ